GNFISNGNVNITHTGLWNNTDNWRSYIDVAMTSFAVRVEGGTVTLNKARISNSVGGGLMCNGGNVTLGTADSVRSDITVETTGAEVIRTSWTPINSTAPDGSWARYKTRTGGTAIEIHGGNLTVYEGTYRAAYGDGIYLKTTNDNDRAIVNIYNGSFTGLMTNDQTSSARSGPAGSYGVKVYGYSLINIYNGEFNGQAGAACAGGASNYNYTNNAITYDSNKKAEVYVYRGKFGNTMMPNDGFMIYDNSKIIFGAGGADIASKDAITCRASLACLSVNWFTYNNNDQSKRKSCDVRIYYGTYQNGSFQGWNKDGLSSETYVYNRNSNPSLTSYTFNQGADREAAVIYRDSNTPQYYNG
ncbi:MAG: hypothetical protein IKT32_05825, partial [Clostridia bacterium]|nr:hypothetical protein [Clostridia bacterium]